MQCTASTKATGQRCKTPAIRGGTVCHKHGGRAPQVKAAAARNLAAQQAAKTMARLPPQPVEDPYAALQLLAGEMVQYKDMLADKVHTLTTDVGTRDAKGAVQIRAEVQVYSQLLRDCTTVLTALGRLSLDDRAIRITEAKALMVITAVEEGLRQAGITGTVATLARQHIARRLRTNSQH